jgi:hypothetical protein
VAKISNSNDKILFRKNVLPIRSSETGTLFLNAFMVS